MENVDYRIEVCRALYNQIKLARLLVKKGQEIPCYEQLQGAETRCGILLTGLLEEQDVLAKDINKSE